MRKLVLVFLAFFFLVTSCEKEEEPGNLKIIVSYYYNDFIGYKPDVGARVFLYTDTYAKCPDWVSSIIGKAYVGEEESDYQYKAEADVNGEIHINNIPSGYYYIVLTSEGRYTYSDKIIDIPLGGTLDLVKNFYYRHEFEEEPW